MLFCTLEFFGYSQYSTTVLLKRRALDGQADGSVSRRSPQNPEQIKHQNTAIQRTSHPLILIREISTIAPWCQFCGCRPVGLCDALSLLPRLHEGRGGRPSVLLLGRRRHISPILVVVVAVSHSNVPPNTAEDTVVVTFFIGGRLLWLRNASNGPTCDF